VCSYNSAPPCTFIRLSDTCVPVTTGMARPQIADGGTAYNMDGSCEILNKQPRTAERGGSPAWELGEVLTTSHLRNVSCYGMFTLKSSDLN